MKENGTNKPVTPTAGLTHSLAQNKLFGPLLFQPG